MAETSYKVILSYHSTGYQISSFTNHAFLHGTPSLCTHLHAHEMHTHPCVWNKDSISASGTLKNKVTLKPPMPTHKQRFCNKLLSMSCIPSLQSNCRTRGSQSVFHVAPYEFQALSMYQALQNNFLPLFTLKVLYVMNIHWNN